MLLPGRLRRCAGRPPRQRVRRLRMSTKRTMASTRSARSTAPARRRRPWRAPRAASASRWAAMRAKRLRKPASWVSTPAARRSRHRAAAAGPGRAVPARAGRAGARRPLRGAAPAGQRALPAGLADEVGHDEDGGAARIRLAADFSRSQQVMPAAGPASVGAALHACSRCSTWRRPLRVGITASTPLPYSIAPTRLPWRVSRRASTPTNSAETCACASRPSRSRPRGSGRAGTRRPSRGLR
jgi:hypothetical protein